MALSDASFAAVCALFHGASGIRLTPAKRALVEGRLHKLAARRGTADLDRYVDALLQGDDDEVARVVDGLTTNETYFFREPAHFEHLDRWLASRPAGQPLRVWSAASSSGEEAYSIAMLLAERRGLSGWEIVGTDLSGAMVEAACAGLFPLERARHVPPAWLKRWCLRGQGAYEGKLLIARTLRDRVAFVQADLNAPPAELGRFDIVFLRNVLIYFDLSGKAAIVRRVLAHLQPDGLLMTGHAESLVNMDLPVRPVASAVYAHA